MPGKFNSTILVAPLDWGLGHSTRCIPIIKHLQFLGCKVIIAAEGAQRKLLQQEFPLLTFVHLKGYRITYTNSKRFFLFKILMQLPKVYSAVMRERKSLQDIVASHNVDVVISDNRYGLTHAKIPCVFITHQLLIATPFSLPERIIQKINYHFINKFSACWVPDEKGDKNFAGLLSHPLVYPKTPVSYLGGLSRLERVESSLKKFDVMIIISGPEPQRTTLEMIFVSQLKTYDGSALLVCGLPGETQELPVIKNVVIKNHLTSGEMQSAYNESEFVISRSGYTTVMDIFKLQKKAILIPTPGQTEQEYLGRHLHGQGWCLTFNQDNFELKNALQQAKSFAFKFPTFVMEEYKKVVEEFINSLQP